MKRFAALQAWPGIVEAARDGRVDGGVHVVGAQQDEGIGATEFEDDLLEMTARGLGDGGAARSEPVSDTPWMRGSAMMSAICSLVA